MHQTKRCALQCDAPYSAHLTKFLTKINHPPIRVYEFYWLQSHLLTLNIIAWIVEICGHEDLVCKCFREMHHFVCFHIIILYSIIIIIILYKLSLKAKLIAGLSTTYTSSDMIVYPMVSIARVKDKANKDRNTRFILDARKGLIDGRQFIITLVCKVTKWIKQLHRHQL